MRYGRVTTTIPAPTYERTIHVGVIVGGQVKFLIPGDKELINFVVCCRRSHANWESWVLDAKENKRIFYGLSKSASA